MNGLFLPLNACLGCGIAWWRGVTPLLTVVLKASLSLPADGRMALLPPAPLVDADQADPSRPAAGLVAARDTHVFKPRADITLLGHTYADAAYGAGAERPSWQARIRVVRDGAPLLDKILDVQALDDARRSELTYDRGARSARNPTGSPTAPAITSSAPGAMPGYGPVPEGWMPRQTQLDPRSRNQLRRDACRLGDNFPWGYFQTAPREQQTDHLRGDEVVELGNVHPGAPWVVAALPGLRPLGVAFGLDPGGAATLLDFHIDTLALRPDLERCDVVARAVTVLTANERARLPLDELVVAAGFATSSTALELPAERPPRDTPGMCTLMPSGPASTATTEAGAGAGRPVPNMLDQLTAVASAPAAVVAPFALAEPGAGTPPAGAQPWRPRAEAVHPARSAQQQTLVVRPQGTVVQRPDAGDRAAGAPDPKAPFEIAAPVSSSVPSVAKETFAQALATGAPTRAPRWDPRAMITSLYGEADSEGPLSAPSEQARTGSGATEPPAGGPASASPEGPERDPPAPAVHPQPTAAPPGPPAGSAGRSTSSRSPWRQPEPSPVAAEPTRRPVRKQPRKNLRGILYDGDDE